MIALVDRNMEFVKTLDAWHSQGVAVHFIYDDGDSIALTGEAMGRVLESCEAIRTAFGRELVA